MYVCALVSPHDICVARGQMLRHVVMRSEGRSALLIYYTIVCGLCYMNHYPLLILIILLPNPNLFTIVGGDGWDSIAAVHLVSPTENGS